MGRRGAVIWVEWGAIVLTVVAVAVLLLQLNAYSSLRGKFPAGLTVAQVNVGGLTTEQASQHLAAVYFAEVDLYYQGDRIPLNPADVEFALDLEAMLQAAGQQRDAQGFWGGFWDFLWGRPLTIEPVPLDATLSERRLQAILANIAVTRDTPPQPPVPIPTTLDFQAGAPGHRMNIEASQPLVHAALLSPVDRQVTLVVDRLPSAAPDLAILARLLDGHLANFDGIYAYYIIDLQTGASIGHNHDVAFSGLSQMKIAILLETLRSLDQPPTPDVEKLILDSILESSNYAANLLFYVIAGTNDGMLGAKILTESMWYLGLENTFIAVPYEEDLPGTYQTPANQRTDIWTNPDSKMQTTAEDLGLLLEMLYHCAAGGGALLAAYPGEITPDECRLILEVLNQNRIGSLIEAGIPEGTNVAHKHGWWAETHGDAGIVFSPGGDYVLVEFLHTPGWLEWQISSPLLADISRATYNFFNFDR